MRNLRFLVWIILFLSSSVTAGQDKVILCEKSDCYSTYEKLNLQIKPLKNATEYSTGYGFFVDISNGFSKIREVDNGLVFQYQGQEKWIMLLAPAWNYEHIKVSSDSGSIFRGKEGLEIVMVEYKEGSDISYEAYITHKNMPDDKIYVISSLGINKSDFKDVISSIRFTSK